MLFTGRITADAEVRTVKGDRTVTSFTVAVNKRFKNKAGEKQEKVSFIRCAYWINSGLAEYLTKGTIVEINGWMEAEAWKGNDGELHANLTCSVDNVKLFGGNNAKPAETEKNAKAKTKEKAKPAAVAAGGEDDDDLPF
ncbi:single-stranded DNA-binding protein [Mucilaginibacter sp. SJ]|uniref:single-stranded DNA-binding protein n=1 Tax=Mucilaginibacter sp. SJ TaxID=3029053 RepID=UPI0023A97EB4|nr:single-stranded DNA-binding protein [Mucilaginibacter sp. SJ]WEA01769.1 single-stranded DNA-binding protein [Mucilaginibacter sp. SJ]